MDTQHGKKKKTSDLENSCPEQYDGIVLNRPAVSNKLSSATRRLHLNFTDVTILKNLRMRAILRIRRILIALIILESPPDPNAIFPSDSMHR